jgi:5-methylcytosine-specific restriction endonuclease McrA
MIRVNRDRVPKPGFLASPRIEESRQYVRKAIQAKKTDIALERLQSDSGLLHREVIGALEELFYGKCAYCETPLVNHYSDIACFRPRWQALNLDGSTDREHYWWLAYEWENLYLSCPTCNHMKGSRFPIEGPRAVAGTPWIDLEQENALLLDPCRDEPERELVFFEDGTLASRTRCGQVTIEVLGLNRLELVEARQREHGQLQYALALLRSYTDKVVNPYPDSFAIETLTHARQPHAALRRQFVAEWMQSLPADVRARLAAVQNPDVMGDISKSILPPEAEESGASAAQFQRYKQETIDEFSKVKLGMESYNLRSKKGAEGYFLRTRLIERIEINNFRNLRSLDIRLGRPANAPPSTPTQQARSEDRSNAPWLALIGENGSGKSSILHAVALALAGDEYRRALPLKPKEVLTFGEQEGYVHVYLSGEDKPIELRYSQDSAHFEATVSEPRVLFLAYGATRLLPRGRHKPKAGTPFARADNLLDPFVPLQDANGWLLKLDDDAFETVTGALKDLLALETGYRFVKNLKTRPPRVEVEYFGSRMPLLHLSDGYQSVVALACDIMAVMLHRWKAMDVAEGIVLIDELEAHLHPRWKQQIAASLRRTFPRIQFLYSTHDPLCLQNASPGEVHIVQRDAESGIVAIRQEDVPPGLRADQILTGWWFSLSKTVDDDTFSKMEEHRWLLLQLKTPENEARRMEIEGILRTRLGGFAETSMERLALGVAAEVIDEEKKDQKELTTEERVAIRAKILDRVKARREGDRNVAPKTPS